MGIMHSNQPEVIQATDNGLGFNFWAGVVILTGCLLYLFYQTIAQFAEILKAYGVLQ